MFQKLSIALNLKFPQRGSNPSLPHGEDKSYQLRQEPIGDKPWLITLYMYVYCVDAEGCEWGEAERTWVARERERERCSHGSFVFDLVNTTKYRSFFSQMIACVVLVWNPKAQQQMVSERLG